MRPELRRSGRTTAMLQQALAEAAIGKQVVVVAINYDHERDLYSQLNTMCGRGHENIRVQLLGQLVGSGRLNPLTLEHRRMDTRVTPTVLVDHYAIEVAYQHVLEMLHRYDPQPAMESHDESPAPDSFQVTPFPVVINDQTGQSVMNDSIKGYADCPTGGCFVLLPPLPEGHPKKLKFGAPCWSPLSSEEIQKRIRFGIAGQEINRVL